MSGPSRCARSCIEISLPKAGMSSAVLHHHTIHGGDYNTMKYVIRFWNKGQTEEYDGGNTMYNARKEAAFFREFVKPDIEIRICKITENGGVNLVEVTK